jgi:hypothetical protein
LARQLTIERFVVPEVSDCVVCVMCGCVLTVDNRSDVSNVCSGCLYYLER